ncbi:MAG: alcohol dehydrogenase catalytic domain-containing protein [Planctomycetes bacterium]|nr:alcohol dehydrogenase catalytic domain-containing protein [Planctomycetota bacterium]
MTDLMRALVKDGASLGVRRLPRPAVANPDDVVVRVAIAGVCRTDLHVADGRLPGRDPIILGHEFSGVVAEVGGAVRGLAPGARVTAMPALPCGACAPCRSTQPQPPPCARPAFLGVDLPGAFAEFVRVPAHAVHRLPDTVSFEAGAFVEPIAACLAVLRSGIRPEQRGFLYGDNRIGRLIQRILHAHGFAEVPILEPAATDAAPLDADAYDFVIETVFTSESLAAMVRALRPGGRLVIKSRQPLPVAFSAAEVVRKELTLQAVNYAPFPAAIGLLAEARIRLDDLLGPSRPLEDFEQVFAACRQSERAKSFFTLFEGR